MLQEGTRKLFLLYCNMKIMKNFLTLNEVFLDKLFDVPWHSLASGRDGILLDFLQKSGALLQQCCHYAGFHNLPEQLRSILLPGPSSLLLHITSDCNLHCQYCYSKDKPSLSRQNWLEIMKQGKDMGAKIVQFLGGEPLLSKDLWPLFHEALKMKYRVILVTNGTLLEDTHIKMLQQFKNRVMVFINIDEPSVFEALCGTREQSEKSWESIRLLSNAHIPVRGFVTVTRHNLPYLKKLLYKLGKFGAFPAVERFQPVCSSIVNQELGLSREQWAEAMRITVNVAKALNMTFPERRLSGLTGYHCSDYVSSMTVMQNGTVVPCAFLPEAQGIGDASSEPLNLLWQRYKRYRKKWLCIPEACQSCDHAYTCRGGCKSYVFRSTGRFDQKDPLCTGIPPHKL